MFFCDKMTKGISCSKRRNGGVYCHCCKGDREPYGSEPQKFLRVWCVYEKCSNCYAGNAQPADPDAR